MTAIVKKISEVAGQPGIDLAGTGNNSHYIVFQGSKHGLIHKWERGIFSCVITKKAEKWK